MPNDTLSLVTGATGQLGSHIVEQLRAAGNPVRALVRPGRETTFLRELGVDVVEGNLHDPAAVRKAVVGAGVVYHCAAKVSDWGPWSEFEEEAKTSTRNVVEACRAGEIERLLHVSSVSVYGHPHLQPGQLITEDTPLGQGFWLWDYYPQAKLLAEHIAREFPRTTVVRPSWIYGPRDRVTTPRVVKALLSKRVPILGPGTNYLNIIYGGDVAAGCILAATAPHALGQTYNLSSQGEVMQQDLLNALTDALGLPRVTKHVPYWLVSKVALAQEAFARLLGKSRPPTITRRAVYLIGRSTGFSTAKARQELGWQPKVSVQEGVRRALAWFFSLPENRQLSQPTSLVKVSGRDSMKN